MMINKRFIFLVFSVFLVRIPSLGFSDSLSLPFKKATHHSIEEMLSYHVEYKEISPLLIKRSSKLFFDQFDPYKIYLLQSEVAAFTDMDEGRLQKVSLDHQMSEYPLYEKMDSCICSAILRARQYRKKIAKDFIETGKLEVNLKQTVSSFSKTEENLVENIKQYLFSLIEIEKKMEGFTDISLEDRQRIVLFLEKKMRKNEDDYLSLDKGRSLSMHIVKAFAKSLDAHTCFFTPEEAQELRMNLEKQFEGVGVVFREGIRGISVKSLLKEGPASKNGKVSVGDI
ncbi:MAG: hypothetical protein JSS09_03500, partial [Verrucomicrobia bacterium]|nr:hypothetical protein [Verrucomicrobiota bacterium]